jgi:hypothetical protein
LKRLAALLVGVVVAAPAATAAPFPARSGESGLLDVPDATVVGMGHGLLAAELRLDHAAGRPVDFGPLPLSVVAGVMRRLEVGLTSRESGQPGDPKPARVQFGAAAKLQLSPPRVAFPGLAVDVVLDRFSTDPVLGARLIASSADLGRIRLTGFAGTEARTAAFSSLSPTLGGALAVVHRSGTEAVLEALHGPRGANLGAALRWRLAPAYGLSLGFNYLPRDDTFQVSLGIGFGPPLKASASAEAQAAPPEDQDQAPAPAPGELTFTDERPRLRLKMGVASPDRLAERRRIHHPPAVSVAAATPAIHGVQAPAPAPSPDDLLEARRRELDGRAQRLATTSEHLDASEAASVAESRRLAERERELVAREQALDARERRVATHGIATESRRLEALEAELGDRERQLAAQHRGLEPALDAARGRVSEAAAREDLDGKEASRLNASASAGPPERRLELRKQALAARERQLASAEAHLVARSEQLDVAERQLRLTAERLDATQRRLDARGARLELLEQEAAEARPVPAPAPAAPKVPSPPPSEPRVEARPEKDKAVFVMVVKSPTPVVNGPEGQAPAPPAPAGAPVHAGLAADKAVVAATVLMFPTPASELSTLDRKGLDELAKLAAKEGCEVLVWARAESPELMAQAQRRAAEVKARILAAAALQEARITTRVTTRPGARGVDVVVSALRDQGKSATSPAGEAPAPAAGPAAARAAGVDSAGDREIREAILARQPAIQGCVGEGAQRKRLTRAEAVLTLTVARDGRVIQVSAREGDLSGAELEACLAAAAASWKLPAAPGEYTVQVPITVTSEGTR